VEHTDSPFVGAGNVIRLRQWLASTSYLYRTAKTHSVARLTEMLVNRHGYTARREDLVLMMVDNHVLRVVVLWCEKSVHPARCVEAIVEHDRRVANLTEIVVSITVEIPDHVLVKHHQERLVHGLNCNHNVLHR
jgi:hypothetical protein